MTISTLYGFEYYLLEMYSEFEKNDKCKALDGFEEFQRTQT